MKGNLKSILTLLLVCSVLLGSVGIAFQKRICQLSGNAITTVSGAELPCCATSGKPAFTADDCCTTEFSLAKLAPVDLVKGFSLRLAAIIPALTRILPACYQQKLQTFIFSDTSPPYVSYRLLHFIQVYRL